MPRSVRSASIKSNRSVAALTVRARPPVPTTVACGMLSSSFMRATSPSACAAAPMTRPDCTAVSVESPSAWGGTTKGTLESFAALEKKQADAARKAAAQLAQGALWKHFFKYYRQAYAIALANAEKRNKQ